MSKQVTFSISDSLKKLQSQLDRLAPALESEIVQGIKETAYAAYATIMAKAQTSLKSTRQDYLAGLKFEDLGGNNFLISLDGDWPNALEEGFPAFNMTAGMLKSSKTVEMGKRAGQPWVQKSAEGHKFAHVPLEKKVGAAGSSNMADSIRAMTAVNQSGRTQKITSIFKDNDGSPLQGKVATGRSDNPMLDGLVKYQSVQQNKAGKNVVRSTYIAYRTVSENGKPWIHPGFPGIRAFEDAEKEIVKQIDNIIKSLL